MARQLERMGVAMIMLEDQARPRRCGHYDGKVLLPLEQYIEKLQAVLAQRSDLCVLARTDATGDEIYRRIEAMNETDADVLLVDGIRSIEVLRKVRRLTGKPLLFNQIAGGHSPRVTLSELRQAGADLVLYSTPCLFAAQTAIASALAEIFVDDGRLPETAAGAAGVSQCTGLLRQNHRAAGISDRGGQGLSIATSTPAFAEDGAAASRRPSSFRPEPQTKKSRPLKPRKMK